MTDWETLLDMQIFGLIVKARYEMYFGEFHNLRPHYLLASGLFHSYSRSPPTVMTSYFLSEHICEYASVFKAVVVAIFER